MRRTKPCGRNSRRDLNVTNAGKEFEKQFKESCPSDVYFLRLHDSAIGFGSNRQAGGFAVKSPYDCIMIKVPKVYALELKSTKENTMSYEKPEQTSKGNKVIKLHQIIELRKAASKGLTAGFILNFRKSNHTYFLPIQEFDKITYQGMTSKASISELDVAESDALLIPQRLKKVKYAYDLSVLF